MGQGISLDSFIRQAATMEEKSDKILVLEQGKLAGATVSSRARRSTDFQTTNRELWQNFRSGLAERFGNAALPPELRNLAASGTPLTARIIIEITKATQGRARMAASTGLMRMLQEAGPDRAFLMAKKPEALADAYISLSAQGNFRAASPLLQQNMMAAHFRAQAAQGDSLAADARGLGLQYMGDGVVFGRDETSVEDRVRAGALQQGAGIGRISRSGEDEGANRYIFAGIKTKGVEPGFLVTKNWLPSHQNAMLGRGPEGEDSPLFLGAVDTAGNYMREKISSADRETAIQAFTVFAGYLPPPLEDHREVLEQVFTLKISPGEALALFSPAVLAEAMTECAKGQLRGQGPSAYLDEISRSAKETLYSTMPEFTEKHVIKLDYNESDRSAGTRSLRLPDRVKQSHNRFFHFFRRTSERSANQGAVSEALANDVTRLLGVPAQKLSLVKGEYADGSPKLLLDSTYLSGQDGTPYQDFDHFIRDGCLDRDLLRASGHGGDIRLLGGYKSAFLLLGDRDAVGSKGQNKGFVGNSFAAIDPGHSLEGSRVTVRDDFSFSFKAAGPFGKGFQNFSVFDDTPLSEKMAGWDTIERQMEGGAVSRLFGEYRAQFGHPQRDGRLQFAEHLDAMESELRARYRQMRETFAPRLAIYRGQDGDAPGLGPALLDSLENVEKLFSGTSETSPNGTVRLDHLRVTKRSAWDMTRKGDGIHISCRNPLTRVDDAVKLREFLSARGVDCSADRGVLVVKPADYQAFIAAMSENNVREHKRAAGGM